MALITLTKLCKPFHVHTHAKDPQRVTSPYSLKHPPNAILQGIAIIRASTINHVLEGETEEEGKKNPHPTALSHQRAEERV